MNSFALIFVATSQIFSLPPGLLSAVCYVESGHHAYAINNDDRGSASIGLCQIKLDTAISIGFKGDATTLRKNPNLNAYYAGKYLHRQLLRYNGDVLKSVAAYNAGTFRLNTKGEIMNRRYVHKVTKAWSENR